MLTLAIVFLILAIVAGAFAFVAAGPAGAILFVVFMGLFLWSLVLHRRERSGAQKKAASRTGRHTSPWNDAGRNRNR